MTEEEARSWVAYSFDVPRGTMEKLDRLAALVAEENERQNLVSSSSLAQIWVRHIADSAQLLRFAPYAQASWIDLGTGAGFPGLVVALLHDGPVTLVEGRRLRAEFLRRAAAELAPAVEIVATRAERLEPRPFDVISARAFAPLPRLFELGTAFSTAKTRWILPKGRNAQSELEAAESSWQGDFRLEPSITDEDASILVVERVARKRKA